MSMSNGMMSDSTVEGLSRFLDVDVARYQLITTNLANLDTPGYRTRDLDFRSALEQAGQQAFGIEGGEVLAGFAPVSHPVRGLMARPDGNNVSVERETLLMAETQMKFNLAVALLKDEFHGIAQAINSGGTTS
jgi:flagellar basal-body rod protein FlgB